ncbi:hypothetical protein [Photorhabdus heterorhabditis]|uniref:hypothetical protein n=1 Tax=Photorhabdus heterorhabditis TaxID=880156 RepID=UPI001562AEB0|nr:hypothetical protein [Photorhabdus heterorhabditis]NRN29847.1 hypothetical protein [Photorhabdus heterorhabditis subsp. aluminescens]
MGEIDRHCGFINHFNINGYGVSRENNVELYRLGHRAINIEDKFPLNAADSLFLMM